jgi:predicted enzyme related to lactoylglutathione lyase
MERVRGLGGFFFKANDPKALSAWYEKALGVSLEKWGGAKFKWHELDEARDALTVWTPFAADTDYFAPSEKPFMVNFRVDDLDKMLAQVRAAGGGQVIDKITDEFNGRFGWVVDPEGNKIELWQPKPKTPG